MANSVWVETATAPVWASVWDTTNQTATLTTASYAISFNTTDPDSRGVSVVTDGSALTRLTVSTTGVYNVQFSAQFTNSDTGSAHNANIWIRVNGVDVPATNGQITVPATRAAIPGAYLAAWNYMLRLSAGSYIQFLWQVESVGVSLQTLPAGSTPVTPVSPSIIATVFLVR